MAKTLSTLFPMCCLRGTQNKGIAYKLWSNLAVCNGNETNCFAKTPL